MKLIQVQLAPWDKKYNFDSADLDVKVGDQVIVKTELGVELGKVAGIVEAADADTGSKNEVAPEIKKIIRLAAPEDLERLPGADQKQRDFEYCREIIAKYQLSMKLVDIHYSFDDSKITFPFIAESRVDFRGLVKDLTKYFGRSIRLQQIGIRDEAKCRGDFGHCGRPLCCGRFLGELNSITSEMAEIQQCVHRGSERISGICGRLMCCLSFEEEGYKELAEKMPALDCRVKVESKCGRVVARHILKQTVDVLLENGNGGNGDVVEAEAVKVKKI